MKNSIYHAKLLYNCFKKLNLCRVFPQTTMKHIMAILSYCSLSCRSCGEFSRECQEKVQDNPAAVNDAELIKENLRLRKELEEAGKENLFLKKAAAFFAKEID